jgi:hypothetical protein
MDPTTSESPYEVSTNQLLCFSLANSKNCFHKARSTLNQVYSFSKGLQQLLFTATVFIGF